MKNIDATITNYAILYGIKLLGALSIFFIGKFAANLVTNIIRNIIKKAKDTRKIDLTIEIGYNDDIKLAKNTLYEICSLDNRILKEPEPIIAVYELDNSSVNLLCC